MKITQYGETVDVQYPENLPLVKRLLLRLTLASRLERALKALRCA